MRQLFSLILAGVFGGLITLAGFYFIQQQESHTQPFLTQSEGLLRSVSQVNVKPAGNADINFVHAAEKAMPAVVHISSKANISARNNDQNFFRYFFDGDPGQGNPFGPQAGTGSGVIYTSDGYIVTNNHVVEFADQLEVTLYDNRQFQATVIGVDKTSDLAVLKIDGDNLPVLDLANSDNARVGEWVLAVGNPFDLTSTVTAGIISAKGRSLRLLGGNDAIEAFIQTDAAVNPGNSGGALIDLNGNLLGINTAIATRTGVFQGYSFAIPINLVQRIVDDIIEYGSFQRAFLGVNIYELDSEAADELGVNISQGVVIQELIDGGSAQYAGLQPKDVITEVNGREVKGVPELQEIVGRAKVGDTIKITVNRRGEFLDIPVRLKAFGNN